MSDAPRWPGADRSILDDLHDLVEQALQQWERRGGDFNAGDAATDVIAVLVEFGLVDEANR